ncbi:hypothetical protein P8452_70126 [Trifolium repens]|nr:hypothetical protein P8452_70126 [Trifolium repens]
MSSLKGLGIEQNHLSGIIQTKIGYSLPNLQYLQLYDNNFVGNIPNTIFNSSKLIRFELNNNAFNGTLPNNAFGNLRFLESIIIHNNNLTIDDSHQFFTSLSNCRYLEYIDISGSHIVSNLPKSIGNITCQYFEASSCGIVGNIPLEVGNMSELLSFSLYDNNLNGPIPGTFKGLHKLQGLNLNHNRLQGSFIEELCETKRLEALYLENNKISGVLPTCLGNLSYLRKIYIGSNNLNSMIPSSLWSLTDILEIDLSSNSFIGNIPLEIGNLRAIISLNLSRNQISSNIPPTINFLKTLQNLSLAHNKVNGSIPASLGDMVSLISLDLSQTMLTGVIPKSLKNLTQLQNINFSYNRLQGEIPDGGIFKNFTAQSFMHNEALCGNPRLQVPLCDNQVKKSSPKKKLLLKCIIPIVVSTILIVASIIILKNKKKKKVENTLERGQSKTHTQTLATIGYLAPEYGSKGIVSVKGDVYSYGIKLMEIFTRRKPTDDMFVAELSLKTWISQSLPNSIMEVLDSNLVQQYGEQIDDILTYMSSIFSLALNCCQDSPEARMNMVDVTVSLIKIKTLVVGTNRA